MPAVFAVKSQQNHIVAFAVLVDYGLRDPQFRNFNKWAAQLERCSRAELIIAVW
jgi:hypothetical protein